MTLTATGAGSATGHDRALREVEEQVLWLATAIVDHANRVCPNPGGRPGTGRGGDPAGEPP